MTRSLGVNVTFTPSGDVDYGDLEARIVGAVERELAGYSSPSGGYVSGVSLSSAAGADEDQATDSDE